MNNLLDNPNKHSGTIDRAKRFKAQQEKKAQMKAAYEAERAQRQKFLDDNADLAGSMITHSKKPEFKRAYASVEEFRQAKSGERKVDVNNLTTKNSISSQIQRHTLDRLKQRKENTSSAQARDNFENIYNQATIEDVSAAHLENYDNQERSEYYAMELGQPVFKYGGATYTVESFAASLIAQGSAQTYLAPYISKEDNMWLRAMYQPEGGPLDFARLLTIMTTENAALHDSIWSEGANTYSREYKRPVDVIIEAMQKYGADLVG